MKQSKACTRCKQIKLLSEFNKLTSAPDGFNYACKQCIKLERIKNKSKRNAYNRRWYEANKDRAAKYQRQHRIDDRAKARELVLRRRARILNNGVFVISQKESKRLYSSPCFYCGFVGDIQADHVVPISKGGRHSIGNLVSACKKCNLNKKAMFIMEWKLHKRRLNL